MAFRFFRILGSLVHSPLQKYLDKIEKLLDIPGFPWRTLILGFTISQYLFEQWLLYRQYQVLKKNEVPKDLNEIIDQRTFDKSQSYSRAKARFSAFTSLSSLAENLITIKFFLTAVFWKYSSNFLKFLPGTFSGEITQSCIYLVISTLISNIVSLPFSYYQAFYLEERYGFNKQTRKIFFTDLIKQFFLLLIIGMPVLAAFLKIIQYFGQQFFYYLWLFILAFQIIMIAIYPTLIQPLFNKLTPLPKGELRMKVENLAASQKFPLKHLYVIDGSKRSSHSNAYFFGLPWSKHIVLFDTLIDQAKVREVVAVLAHELGHWKLSHTTKTLLLSQAQLFMLFVLFGAFIRNKSIYSDFGFHNSMPIMIGFFLYTEILTPLNALIGFTMNWFTRKNEYQADAFAKQLGYAEPLARGLIKLQKENLGAMDADPIYSAYYHSHPILHHRLKALGFKGKIE